MTRKPIRAHSLTTIHLRCILLFALFAQITKLFSENSTQNGDIITDMLSVNASNLQPTEPNLNSNLNGNLQSSAAIKTNYSSDSSPQPLNQARSKTAYIRLNLTVLEEKYNFINWRFLFGLMESSAQRKKGDKKLAVSVIVSFEKTLFSQFSTG